MKTSYRQRPIYPERYLPDQPYRQPGKQAAGQAVGNLFTTSRSSYLSLSLPRWLIFVCFVSSRKKQEKEEKKKKNKTPSTSEFGSTAFWPGANKFMSSSGLDNDAKGATKLADGQKKW